MGSTIVSLAIGNSVGKGFQEGNERLRRPFLCNMIWFTRFCGFRKNQLMGWVMKKIDCE